jgi:hypothetical protein
MNNELTQTAKGIGDEIINLSLAIDNKMEKWSDSNKRPDDLNSRECVGFINKEDAIDGMNIMVDLRVPSNDNKAVLRTWAIDNQLDSDNIERFNNIQLAFLINYDQARARAQKGGEVTRDDLRQLLNLEDTMLIHVVVSDQSGLDESKGGTVGERYELDIDESTQQGQVNNTIDGALKSVIGTLKDSAVKEQ